MSQSARQLAPPPKALKQKLGRKRGEQNEQTFNVHCFSFTEQFIVILERDKPGQLISTYTVKKTYFMANYDPRKRKL